MPKEKLNWKINKIKDEKSIQISDKKNEEIIIKQETLIRYMENYLEESDIKSNSKKTYFKGLKKFIHWISKKINKNNNENKIKISKIIIQQYKEFLASSNANIKPHTQAINLVALKQFFVWTESNLLIPNIAKNIKGIKKVTKQHHKDPLNQNQIKKLLEIPENKNLSNISKLIKLRNQALIHALLLTGMRIGETTNILLEDIEKINEKKSIIWIKGKGQSGKDNFVILLQETSILIKEYLEMRLKNNENLNEKSFLFLSHGRKTNGQQLTSDGISKIVSKEMKKKNIKTKKISAHSLRHTFGVNAINAGISLYDLQIAMRHSTPTTTQVYLGDIEKIKRKEGIVEEKIWDYININKAK